MALLGCYLRKYPSSCVVVGRMQHGMDRGVRNAYNFLIPDKDEDDRKKSVEQNLYVNET